MWRVEMGYDGDAYIYEVIGNIKILNKIITFNPILNDSTVKGIGTGEFYGDD